MRIAVASDHAGFELKEKAKAWLSELGFEVVDLGCESKESCDYPVFAKKLARMVASGNAHYGFMSCGTGVGSSIALNRFKGVRAALCTNVLMARQAREHVNANILVMGEKTTIGDTAKNIITAFYSTGFSGVERHERRVRLIDE